MPRPTDVPDQGLVCDLLWSDPEKNISGWVEEIMQFGGDRLMHCIRRVTTIGV